MNSELQEFLRCRSSTCYISQTLPIKIANKQLLINLKLTAPQNETTNKQTIFADSPPARVLKSEHWDLSSESWTLMLMWLRLININSAKVWGSAIIYTRI